MTGIDKSTAHAFLICAEEEGCELTAYRCPAGIWTIGYGHTKGVRQGMTCTKEQALAWLREDIAESEDLVNRKVLVPLKQHQFDALTSFVFNIRKSRFNERDCTLLRRLNAGDYNVGSEFQKWVKGAGKSGKLVTLPGLVVRRTREELLYRFGCSINIWKDSHQWHAEMKTNEIDAHATGPGRDDAAVGLRLLVVN